MKIFKKPLIFAEIGLIFVCSTWVSVDILSA